MVKVHHKIPSEKTKKIIIKIKNAETEPASQLTYYFYDLVDQMKIKRLNIRNVRKSKNCVDLVIEAIGAAILIEGFKIIFKEIMEKIEKWEQEQKEKKRQTTIDVFTENEDLF